MNAWTRSERLKALRAALGGREELRGKLRRMRKTLAIRRDRGELRRRLTRLHEIGLIDQIPTRRQLSFGGADMLRFSILPAAKDYYRLKRIPFRFYYFLRFVEDPVSMLDPIGLYSDQEAIVGHLLQSVHLNPIYDLQLLQMFERGLDNLEAQTRAMIDGSHPRHATITATVEDPAYHQRLLDYVVAYRKDPLAPPPLRESSLRDDREFQRAEAQFHTLPGFTRYAARLPSSLPELVRHRFGTKRLDAKYLD
ncbi:MAG: hypothetical protein AB7O24_17100 [Kofleriaceae bacterium]